MYFNIIPFFLVSEIATNGTWMHGPEFTFDVNIEMSTSIDGSMTFSMLMKCRPKEQPYLICHLEQTRMSPENPEIMAELNLINNIVFQVNYNRWASPSNITLRTLPTNYALNIIQFIVDGLNVDLDDRVGQSFFFDRLKDTSAYGRCLAATEVKRTRMFDEELENPVGKLIVPSFKTKSPEEKIIIQKTREPKKCDRRTHYFFTASNEPMDVHTIVTTIKSTILISNNFESKIVTGGFAFRLGNTKRTLIYQRLTLRLIRIDPAKEALIKSQTGFVFSPFIYDNLVLSDSDNMYFYHINE